MSNVKRFVLDDYVSTPEEWFEELHVRFSNDVLKNVLDGLEWWASRFAKIFNMYSSDKSILGLRVKYLFGEGFVEETHGGPFKVSPVLASWMYARMFGHVGYSWVCRSSSGFTLCEKNVLHLVSERWNLSLLQSLDLSVAALAVWRVDRKHAPHMPRTLWDVFEDEEYMFPYMRKEVKGSVNSEGLKFVWMLALTPDAMLSLIRNPVGGMAGWTPVNVKLSDVLAGAVAGQELWVSDDAGWTALEALMALEGVLPQMDNAPVVRLSVKKVSRQWAKVLFNL